jgi:cystathionine beta-lyase/cystathionine gamma-synthase
MSPEDRGRLGISDGLIRVSIGIESTDDLLEDFSRALSG